jgi:hypothetical protein
LIYFQTATFCLLYGLLNLLNSKRASSTITPFEGSQKLKGLELPLPPEKRRTSDFE